MRTQNIGGSLLLAAGAGLISWGLFRPLVFVPVIHDVAYMDNDVAGIRCTYLAYVLIGLFAASVVLSFLPRFGFGKLAVLAVAAFGALGWSLYEIYRYRWGTLEEFASMGMVSIETIRKGLRPELGLWLIVGGLLAWLAGLCVHFCSCRRKRPAAIGNMTEASEVVPL